MLKELKTVMTEVLQEIKASVIYTTHDLLGASMISDRIAVLNHGEIEQVGYVNEVFENPNSRFIAEFFGYNVFNGRLISVKEGQALIDIGGILLQAEGSNIPLKNEVTVVIRPQDIILSPKKDVDMQKWRHCTCNVVEGVVTQMYMVGSMVEVITNIGNLNVKTDVSMDQIEELNIKVGSKVYLRFKASKVKILQK